MAHDGTILLGGRVLFWAVPWEVPPFIVRPSSLSGLIG
jgi:hypothetical protein